MIMMKKQNSKELREIQRIRDMEQRKFPYGTIQNVYKGRLELIGEMSQIPDSQKLFGAIVYLLADNNGYSAASEFVGKVKNRNIDFALSSAIPEGFLPTPKAYLLREAQEMDEKRRKSIYTNIKKLDYVAYSDIIKMVADPKSLSNENINTVVEKGFVRLITSQQVHVNTLYENNEDNHIFSIQRTTCMHNEKTIRTFEFYIRTDYMPIINLLKNQQSQVLTLGKRSSQGYNLFILSGVNPIGSTEKLGLNSANSFLNLGMQLPNNIDYCNFRSALMLFSSERRPYTRGEKTAWDDSENRGFFISFLAPGSIIVLPNAGALKNAGKSIPAPTAVNGEIVFGNAFLYPLEVNNA